MWFRPVRKPIFLGLSTAAIFAAGAVVPLPAHAAPGIDITITASSTVMKPGGAAVPTKINVKATGVDGLSNVTVTVTLGPPAELDWITCPGKLAAPDCTLDKVNNSTGETIETEVSPPEKVSEDKSVTLSVTAKTEGVPGEPAAGSGAKEFTIQAPPPSTTPPPPSKTPTKSPTKKPTQSETGRLTRAPESRSGGGGSGSGGSGGSSDSSGTSASGPAPFAPPSTDSSQVAPAGPLSPNVALPPVAPQTPQVAQATSTSASRLRADNAATPQELSFERLASAQAAWLAALMVAFSLLLTQVRIGRKRAAAVVRSKGMHRRPRRGLFSR